MAIYGSGNDYDITFKLDSSLQTTSSQYMVVGMVGNTTAAADSTVCLAGATGTIADATTAAFAAIGILQSYQSSGSEVGTVRMFGRAKVTCAQSISVGDWVCAYYGVSTTTMCGKIVVIDNAVSTTVATQSITAQFTVLGRALESGSTNTVIQIFLNPQMYDKTIAGTLTVT